MVAAEAITGALSAFFSGFDIPVYPEDFIPKNASLPYLTVLPVIPADWGQQTAFHARLWYPSNGGKRPILKKSDEIRTALADGKTIPCEGGAIFLRAGDPWAQSMDNPAENYLCTYLNFEVTSYLT